MSLLQGMNGPSKEDEEEMKDPSMVSTHSDTKTEQMFHHWEHFLCFFFWSLADYVNTIV